MRTILIAELLSVGSELTVGETRDTNAGELARSLTDHGVEVVRMTALPDDLGAVGGAFEHALGHADLVVSTGGLGPTPDDLTRESIARAVGETPVVDPDLEAWLRRLFERRGIPFPASNVKQAWLLPSATAIPNDNGTAPGWWVDRPDGRVIVALPGPPREMRPMWGDWALPRLEARGLGHRTATATLRTTGLGESIIADRLGPLLDRGANPTVATYARVDAVDIRISAVPTAEADAPTLVAAAEQEVMHLLGDHVWARGDTSWPAAVDAALSARGWTLAIDESGTRGAVGALFGEGLGDRLLLATSRFATGQPGTRRSPAATDAASLADTDPDAAPGGRSRLVDRADAARTSAGADVGLAVRATARGADLTVAVAVVDPDGQQVEQRVAFLGGPMGRSRAALLAAAALHARLTRGNDR